MPYAVLQDEEAEIRQRLESLNLPDSIVETRLFLDTDSSGDPAVYIYFILSDGLSEDSLRKDASGIRKAVRDALWTPRSIRYPYVQFRLKSEQDDFDRKGWRGR